MNDGHTLGAMPVVVEPLDSVKELPVEPGSEAVARFSVRNTGNDVNNFTFAILGEPALWPDSGIRVVGDPAGERKPTDDPPELDLLPSAKGEVELTFRPPTWSGTAPGLVPYELLVCSYAARNDKEEKQVEVVQDGLLAVATFRKRGAQLLPRTSRGRHRGRHRLAVDNFGNSPAIASFESEDAENLLDVRFRPRRLVVAPGTAGFTKVRVRPRRRFLLGPPRAAPFKIHVTFTSESADGVGVPDDGQISPVDGLFMQRGVVPPLLIPLGILLAAAVILWALFRPEARGTAAQLGPAQQAARTQAIATKANNLAAQSNALTRQAIKTAHTDAAKAQKQSAQAARATRKQAAQAAGTARKDAKQMQRQAAAAATAAAGAGAQATTATRAAAKALEAATPSFTGAPHAQTIVQPFTAQSFPAHTFYVTDVVVGNPGGGNGTLTLTLGGKPAIVEPLTAGSTADLKLSTPLLVHGDQALAVHVACAQSPCKPSVLVSGFAPPTAPAVTGARGVPSWSRLSRSCASCTVLTVPANATSFEVTDVVFQNPAGETGTLTLGRGSQQLLAVGIDASKPGDVPVSLTAPIVLGPRERLTLRADCRSPSGTCAAGVLLSGVLKLRP